MTKLNYMHSRRLGQVALLTAGFMGLACSAHTDVDNINRINQFFAKAQLAAEPTIVDCT